MITRWRTPERALLAYAAAALLVLIGAFAFQHIGGMVPCPICIWQRWPYAMGTFAILVGFLPFANSLSRGLFVAAALIFLGGAGLSGWHAGIEYSYWEGPKSCAAPLLTREMTSEELLEAIESTPVVRCDVAAWSLAEISLAGWSTLILLLLAALTFHASGKAKLKDRVRRPSTENRPNSCAKNSGGIFGRSP